MSPLTCSRKYGLNGTVTRGSPVVGRKNRTDSRLIASRIPTNHMKPGRRCAGGPFGACSGMPRPSGAGETCQPRLSRGIGGWASDRLALRRSASFVGLIGQNVVGQPVM